MKLTERKLCIQHNVARGDTFDQYSDRFPEATLVIVFTGHICRQHGCSRVGNFSGSLRAGWLCRQVCSMGVSGRCIVFSWPSCINYAAVCCVFSGI